MRNVLLATLALISNGAYGQTASQSTAVNSSSVSNPKVRVIGNSIGNGASSSNSGARANTRSASRSAATGNTTTVNVGSNGNAADPSGTAADPSGQYIGYGGSLTVRNTPEVIPPNVVGGNPCAVGASGGVSAPGLGLALGSTWADKACERRQQAALLFNMGEPQVALELLCQDDNVRAAMKLGGKPCTADTVATVHAPALATAEPSSARPKPRWCAKAAPSTEASKAYVAQMCGQQR